MIDARHGATHKLGLALHMGFLRLSGRSLNAVRVVPVSLWAHLGKELDVVQKVTFLGNTGNVNFGWFAYDSTDGRPKKCYPFLNHTLNCLIRRYEVARARSSTFMRSISSIWSWCRNCLAYVM